MRKWLFLCVIPFLLCAEDGQNKVKRDNKNLISNQFTMLWYNMHLPLPDSNVEGNSFLFGETYMYEYSPDTGVFFRLSLLSVDGSNDYRKYDDDGSIVPANDGLLRFVDARISLGYAADLEEMIVKPAFFYGVSRLSGQGPNTINSKVRSFGGSLILKAPVDQWYSISVEPAVMYTRMVTNRFQEKLAYMQNTKNVPALEKSKGIGAELLTCADFRFGKDEAYVIQLNPFIRAYRFDYRDFMYGVGLTAGYAF